MYKTQKTDYMLYSQNLNIVCVVSRNIHENIKLDKYIIY